MCLLSVLPQSLNMTDDEVDKFFHGYGGGGNASDGGGLPPSAAPTFAVSSAADPTSTATATATATAAAAAAAAESSSMCRLKELQLDYAGIHGYLSLTVCILGTIANLLNIIVLTRKEMNGSPINRILTGETEFRLRALQKKGMNVQLLFSRPRVLELNPLFFPPFALYGNASVYTAQLPRHPPRYLSVLFLPSARLFRLFLFS